MNDVFQFLTMSQKISKHCANHASNDVHRPPLSAGDPKKHHHHRIVFCEKFSSSIYIIHWIQDQGTSRGQNSFNNGCFAKEATIDDIFLEFVNVSLVTLAFALLSKDQRVFVSFPSLTSQREETNFITTPEESFVLKKHYEKCRMLSVQGIPGEPVQAKWNELLTRCVCSYWWGK